MTSRPDLPVAVIGAGPVGLAAAAHLVERGFRPLVFERGRSVGAALLEWGHVRVFSPWRYNIDAAARGLLERTPAGALPIPTGCRPAARSSATILAPLAAAAGDRAESEARRDRDRDHPAGARQGFERGPRGCAVRRPLRRRNRRAPRSCPGGDRRVRHLDAAEPDRRRRPCRSRRTRRRADRIAYGIPDVVGAAQERLCRQARAGDRRRPFGDQRRAGADGAAGGSARRPRSSGRCAATASTSCSAAG